MIDWSIPLPDQVVVTATASGLGQQTARLLLDAGVRVYGVDVAEAPELAEADTFTGIRGDVTDAGTWRKVVAALGPVTSLGFVGAAAVLDVGILDDEDPAVWRRAWEINVLGNVVALQALLPLLEAAEHGAVVAVSSVNAQFGEQQLAAYSSSKAALCGTTLTADGGLTAGFDFRTGDEGSSA
jgi:NAD(P)-dependent dehydrogenase (short-subunit alcohol dehydrogenase family)